MQKIDKIWDNRTPLKKTKTKKNKKKKSTTRAIASRAKNGKV